MIKEEIRQLRKQGYSFSEIARTVGKSRKFVWKVSKDISFSEEGSNRYNKEVKGITKKIKQQNTISVQKVRIISHLLFDRTIFKTGYHKIVRYINSSKELIGQFIKDVEEVYGLNLSSFEIIQGVNLPTYKVSFSSKEFYNDLLKYSLSYSTSKEETTIPKEILGGNKEVKIEFLRAFWQDEGSISSIGRISGDLKSKKVINQIIDLHKEFGLNLKLIKYLNKNGFIYKVYLLKSKENLERFCNLRLFDKSIITHSKNLGKRKFDVLLENIAKLKKL